MLTPRAHDLLWLATPLAQAPPWANPAWPVVVRRAQADAGSIPVGVRGPQRSERHPAFAPTGDVLRQITPEQQVNHAIPATLPDCPALRALAAAKAPLNASGFGWGPTGSVAFALATGVPLLRADSDLDLLLRSPLPFTPAQTDALRAIVTELSHICRIDLQIDTGHGAFAFAEWATGRGRVMLKTDGGPLLTATPWSTLWSKR